MTSLPRPGPPQGVARAASLTVQTPPEKGAFDVREEGGHVMLRASHRP